MASKFNYKTVDLVVEKKISRIVLKAVSDLENISSNHGNNKKSSRTAA